MAVPEWGLLVLVVYPLLQIPLALLLARYVRRDDDRTEPPPPEEYPLAVDRPSAPPGLTACPRCGAHNDDEFAYCQHCLSRLP
jgi:hypothetical protein